jgi:hypothetical protein
VAGDGSITMSEATSVAHCSVAFLYHISENVLIGRDGYPVVIDFGFAKYVVTKTYMWNTGKYLRCCMQWQF